MLQTVKEHLALSDTTDPHYSSWLNLEAHIYEKENKLNEAEKSYLAVVNSYTNGIKNDLLLSIAYTNVLKMLFAQQKFNEIKRMLPELAEFIKKDKHTEPPHKDFMKEIDKINNLVSLTDEERTQLAELKEIANAI